MHSRITGVVKVKHVLGVHKVDKWVRSREKPPTIPRLLGGRRLVRKNKKGALLSENSKPQLHCPYINENRNIKYNIESIET